MVLKIIKMLKYQTIIMFLYDNMNVISEQLIQDCRKVILYYFKFYEFFGYFNIGMRNA